MILLYLTSLSIGTFLGAYFGLKIAKVIRAEQRAIVQFLNPTY